MQMRSQPACRKRSASSSSARFRCSSAATCWRASTDAEPEPEPPLSEAVAVADEVEVEVEVETELELEVTHHIEYSVRGRGREKTWLVHCSRVRIPCRGLNVLVLVVQLLSLVYQRKEFYSEVVITRSTSTVHSVLYEYSIANAPESGRSSANRRP